MVSHRQIHRRMENFLRYNSANENRFDHPRAVFDKRDWSKEMQRRNRRFEPEKPMRKIANRTYYLDEEKTEVKRCPEYILRVPFFGGEFVYDFKNKKETYFKYKSRGKKQ